MRSTFRATPAARRSGSGREAAHLDLEQFRTIQVCPKDLPIRSVAGWACGGPTGRGKLHVRSEAAPVHHTGRWRGRVAARGERAADAEAADHRVLESHDGFG